MSTERLRRFAARAAVGVGLVLWVVVPVVCIALVRGRADRVRLRGNEATSVEVLANTRELVTDAGLRMTWATHSPVVAPGWVGTVTEIRTKVGDRAMDGATAVVIDGVDRVLVASRRPFARPLAEGDRGPDVADLNDLLRRRGLEATSGDRFGPPTTRGVIAFGTAIGAGPAKVFDPAWVLYLSRSGARVATVAGTVGSPAPAAGEVVLGLAPDLLAATVIAHQDQPPDAAPAGGEPRSGSPAPGSPAPTAAGGLPAAALADVEPVEVPERSTIRIDGTELALGRDRSTIAGRSMPALAKAVGTSTVYADATISTPPADDERIVPAAAVVADQQGGTCVQAAGRAIAVRVLGGDGGQSVIVPLDRGTLAPGTRVAVRVPAGDRSCR